MTPFCISTIRRFILRCKIDQRSATQIGDAVNKYHRQNCPGTPDFDEVMCTADFEGFFGTPSAQIFLCTKFSRTYTVRSLIYSTVVVMDK